MFTLQVEKENQVFCMRFDPLFKNTNLASQRKKEGKEGRQGGREEAAGGNETVSQENKGRKQKK